MKDKLKRFIEKFKEQTGYASMIEVHGTGELLLTGCRTLLDFDDNTITVDTVNVMVRICGKGLSITAYRHDLLCVIGEINVIDMGGVC